MLCARFHLSLRNVEDLLHERGIEVSYGSVRFCWNHFRPDSGPRRVDAGVGLDRQAESPTQNGYQVGVLPEKWSSLK
jgi:hypothetical protein